MAVVFISPKKRQRTFFVVITLGFLILLASISLGVFLSKPKEVSSVVVFNKSKINIDMSIFDSEKFKNLKAVPEMLSQYNYKAVSKNGKVENGFISAISEADATKALNGLGLSVNSLQKSEIGRENPFSPYYQVVAAPVVITTPVSTTATTTTTTSSATSTTTTNTSTPSGGSGTLSTTTTTP